ncbi:MAG: hypothetical protein H5U03_02105 [Clostridia bacterium]|nr:hypothetical protein [Clostridia bacterium]
MSTSGWAKIGVHGLAGLVEAQPFFWEAGNGSEYVEGTIISEPGRKSGIAE